MVDNFIEIIAVPIYVAQCFLLSVHTAPDSESDAKMMAVSGMILFSLHLLRSVRLMHKATSRHQLLMKRYINFN